MKHYKAHFQKYYNLPFLERGIKVFYKPKNKFGKIVYFGEKLHIKLNGEDKSLRIHPTENIIYYDKSGNVLKEF